MPRICYVEKTFTAAHEEVIEQANEIVDEYLQQGFRLTLRQLYYQFVARGKIPNTMRSYKRLGSIVNDARLAGRIDWNAIEDRTRELRYAQQWESPSEIVRASANGYRIDRWKGQEHRVEVWIEKDALLGVIEDICRQWDVSYFSCRGYVSQSEMWGAAQRILGYEDDNQRPVIIHLGDHDPSGIDMTRDITDRFELMSGIEWKVTRIALNMDQVEEFNPPPNPAKTTDSRYAEYVLIHGDESWELDALEPSMMVDLISRTIASYVDQEKYDAAVVREEDERRKLTDVADRFDEEQEMEDE